MTPTTFEILSVVLIGYLLGSVPFAVIMARRKGIDILKTGSGNPGATNIKRIMGKRAGNICFGLDFLKGVVAAGWPMLPILGASDSSILGILGLAAAIGGHSFSMFIGFRGGKGVAVTVGGLAVIMFWVILAAIVVWLITFYATRYVSLASLLLGVSLPIFAVLLHRPSEQITLAFILAVLISFRHRGNIKRLLQGRESRFKK